MDDNLGEWVESMCVGSGRGEQEPWVRLVGGIYGYGYHV